MRRLILLVVFFSALLVSAQTRLAPHVTVAGGDFTTQIILANSTADEAAWSMTAFDQSGVVVAEVGGSQNAGSTAFFEPAVLFGEARVSHFQLTAPDGVDASVVYQAADAALSSPAHVQLQTQSSRGWRLYLGNAAVTWDALAVVNSGDQAVDVQVRYWSREGGLLDVITAVADLGANAKGLHVLVPPADAAYAEVVASQPLSLVALRGGLDGSFMWENRATPISVTPAALSYEAVTLISDLGFGLIDLQVPDDGSGRVFGVFQDGRILILDRNGSSDPVTFLDITSQTRRQGEMGLLGLALDPNFDANGYFYVNYVAFGPQRTVISRFQADRIADPNSELVLLEVDQPFTNHNGGQLAFGPDGYLYIALGDGGSARDPFNHSQNTTNLLGTILRIDVSGANPTQPYAVPSDNPFVGQAPAFREEIYAYGLRNPWRFSFDGSRLLAADVGQNEWEEIDEIIAGGNYGWRITEGPECFNPPQDCDRTGLIDPWFAYDHSGGDFSVTGGFVYRGKALPGLYGAYIYGDFVSGRIWALYEDASGALVNTLLFRIGGSSLSSFGVDADGELLICDYNGALLVPRVVIPDTP